MKKSSNILVGILIVFSLAIGFIIGILVDYPKPGEEALSGSIGRISNYRDVKISESDIRGMVEFVLSKDPDEERIDADALIEDLKKRELL